MTFLLLNIYLRNETFIFVVWYKQNFFYILHLIQGRNRNINEVGLKKYKLKKD